MRNTIKILSILFVFLSACKSENKNIFWISEPNGQENDVLFMAESTNIPKIKPDSLVHYLTKEELVSAEKLTFKNFGKIHNNEQFDVFVLLKEGSDEGRDYTFIIRTYDKKFIIIDSYELASWVDTENKHCYGSIDKNLIMKRTCKNGKEKTVVQIANDGRIVTTSFHRRK